MTEQKPPKYNQGLEYGGPMASHSEYRPGEQAAHIDAAGDLQSGEVLHISNGPGGQLYVIANDETGWPDILPASQITEPKRRSL